MSGARHTGRPAGHMDAPRSGPRRPESIRPKVGFLAVGTSEEDWRHRAECRPGRLESGDLGADLMFPVGSTGPSVSWIEDAKAVCRRCPVVEACLAFALDHGYEYGVWGGTSEDERRAMRRREARTRAKGRGEGAVEKPVPARRAAGGPPRDAAGHFAPAVGAPAPEAPRGACGPVEVSGGTGSAGTAPRPSGAALRPGTAAP